MSRNPIFWGLVLFEIAAVFVLDYHHEAEQDVYNGLFIQSARSLWETGTYVLNGEPAFHPIWGYSFLVLLCGFSPVILLMAQGALCFGAIYYFYATIPIKPRLFHIPAMLPFIALCSVKWPNAITGALLVIFICSFHSYLSKPLLKTLLIGGFAAGLAVNMRGEAWIWGPALFISLIFPLGPGMRTKGATFGLAVIFIQLLCISPWSARAYANLGTPMLTPSYGGFVALISLGQLPNNPWGAEHTDAYGQKFAAAEKLGPAFSPAADAAMKKEFLKRVAAHPAAFAEKVIYNFTSVLTHGVFAGQFFTLALTESDYWKVLENSKAVGVVPALRGMPPATLVPLGLHVCLESLFRAGWLLLLTATFVGAYVAAKRGVSFSPFISLTLSLTAVTIIVVSVLQYQPRHVTLLWLPLAASLLLLGSSSADSAL